MNIMHTVNCYAHTVQQSSFKAKDKNIKLLRKTNDWCRLPDRIQLLKIPAKFDIPTSKKA